MAFVICPTCGEKGRLSKELIGKRIKCQKCGTSFQVTAPVKAVTAAAAPVSASGSGFASAPAQAERGDTIAVDGLDDAEWTSAPAAAALEMPHEDAPPAFTAAHEPHHEGQAGKEYKVLTSKDKFFNNKFEIGLLEPALNHYARLGWVVRSMATPHVTGFSGGPREELVVLLER